MALALGLHNTVELVELEYGLYFDLYGNNSKQELENTANLALLAASGIFRKAGYLPGGLRIGLENHIPPGSSLGGDAAALLGGAIAANILLGSPFTREELLHQIIEIENRPHALLAALFGGLVINSQNEGNLIYAPVQIAPMMVVVVRPTTKSDDPEAALSQQVNLDDAICNIGNAALVVQALSTGDIELLARTMHDRLHEEAHSKAIPGYSEMHKAALQTGAAAVAICGTGPALIAFAEGEHDDLAEAMAHACRKATGDEAQTWVVPVDTQGISISEIGMTSTQKPTPASKHPVKSGHQKSDAPSPNSDVTHNHAAPQPLVFVPRLEGSIP